MNHVEEIKNRLDIVDIVGSYIALNQNGTNFKARCPFHNEKTPSFMVSREKQIYHCFGCDKGGDIISFVQEYEGIDFQEALKILAEKANVELPKFGQVTKKDNSRLYEINEIAAKFYQDNLSKNSEVNKKVLGYLERRKISNESIEKWRLGISDESWDGLYSLLNQKGFKDEEIFQAGLSLKKKSGAGYVDRFRKRLMFPIADFQGRVVAFTSRTLAGIAYDEEEQGGKYVNSPQTAIYDKSKILYGWHLGKDDIRQKKYLIIVEGNMDAIAASQSATKNVVAVSGTALTTEHIKMIKRYTDNVILAFDGDAAGSRAVFRSISLGWQADMNLKILVLPKGKDPADMIKEDEKAWLKSVKESIPVMDYYFRRVLAGVDINRSDHKKIAVNKLLPIIKFLKSDIERAHYLKILSDKLQIPLGLLEKNLSEAKSFLEAEVKTEKETISEKVNKKDQLYMLSEQLLIIAFYHNEYLEKLMAEIEPDMLTEDFSDLYKQTIIYYTKHQNLDNFIDNPELSKTDKDNWTRLVLAGSRDLADISQGIIVENFNNLLWRLQLYGKNQQRNNLINQLRQAELNGDENAQDEISHKINLLNKEINKLQR